MYHVTKKKMISKDLENNSQIILYQTDEGKTRVEVKMDGETVWLTQDQMAELFEKGRSTVAEHILNVFNEGELEEISVCREFRRTGSDGKEYQVKHYNLDVIISVERAMTMNDWIGKLDNFLKLSEKDILTNAGQISAEQAEQIADTEYEKYRASESKKMISDFDREIKKIEDSLKS